MLDCYSGDVVSVPHNSGPKPLIGRAKEFAIVDILMARPDKNTGTWESISTIFRMIKSLGYSRKQLQHVILRRSDVQRAEFMEEMGYLSADMIVWLVLTFVMKDGSLVINSYRLAVRGKRLSCIAVVST